MITGGLNKLKKDSRDFIFGAIFPKVDISKLPKSYYLHTLGVKHQGNTDMCAAFSTAVISELQEKVELSPEYLFAKAKQIIGEWNAWGLSLREIALFG